MVSFLAYLTQNQTGVQTGSQVPPREKLLCELLEGCLAWGLLAGTKFPNLFEKCANPDLPINQAYSDEGCNIQFRRNFQHGDLLQWQDLLDKLQELQLSKMPDRVSWRLESSGKFSTRSLYLALCNDPTLTLPVTNLIWKPKLPLKNKIFTWQM
jgi:hypothetical protein